MLQSHFKLEITNLLQLYIMVRYSLLTFLVIYCQIQDQSKLYIAEWTYQRAGSLCLRIRYRIYCIASYCLILNNYLALFIILKPIMFTLGNSQGISVKYLMSYDAFNFLECETIEIQCKFAQDFYNDNIFTFLIRICINQVQLALCSPLCNISVTTA